MFKIILVYSAVTRNLFFYDYTMPFDTVLTCNDFGSVT